MHYFKQIKIRMHKSQSKQEIKLIEMSELKNLN